MLKTLRLQSLTYSGTCPDGNCLFNAASQCTSGHVYDTLIQQADRGQDQHAELRQKAVDMLRSSVWISTGLQDEQTAEYTLGKYPQQLCFTSRTRQGGASQLLASAIASPKTWAGTWSIKALAVALHRNFVVINPEKCELYTRDDAVDSRGSQTWPSVFYPRGKHTRKGNNRVDLPSEALDAATCFIVYDGQAHFWAALRDAEPPTLEQMLAAGMVMEAPFSTV
ncbi:TPA: hypothetical protein ACH3X1_008772 [Trebouxia sp. C0004]